MTNPSRFRSSKILANVFIAIFLTLTTIDSIPLPRGQDNLLKKSIDPIVDVLGIWQGTWDLFAPVVDKANHRVIAEIYLSGKQEPIRWSSPDWRQMNCIELFLHSREIEYYDRIRSIWNRPAQESFAVYLKRSHEAGNIGSAVTAISLITEERRISIFSENPLITVGEFYHLEFQDE